MKKHEQIIKIIEETREGRFRRMNLCANSGYIQGEMTNHAIVEVLDRLLEKCREV